MNSWKTNTVAAFGIVIILICLSLVAFKIATLSEVGDFAGSFALILSAVGFWLTKDKTATHSKPLEEKIKKVEEDMKARSGGLGSDKPPEDKDEKRP
jgi:hypothetical protein